MVEDMVEDMVEEIYWNPSIIWFTSTVPVRPLCRPGRFQDGRRFRSSQTLLFVNMSTPVTFRFVDIIAVNCSFDFDALSYSVTDTSASSALVLLLVLFAAVSLSIIFVFSSGSIWSLNFFEWHVTSTSPNLSEIFNFRVWMTRTLAIYHMSLQNPSSILWVVQGNKCLWGLMSAQNFQNIITDVMWCAHDWLLASKFGSGSDII